MLSETAALSAKQGPSDEAPATVARSARFAGALFVSAVCIVASAAVAVLLHRQQAGIVSRAGLGESLGPQGRIKLLATVIRETRAVKLITVVVDSTVRAKMSSESWRGDASATVESPVRYLYGVDLDKLDDRAFRYDPVFGRYVLTASPPIRLATEVDGSHPVHEVVAVTGTRTRSLSGETQLSLARKALYDEARNSDLPREKKDDIRRITREQLEAVLRVVVGPQASVRVRFSDE